MFPGPNRATYRYLTGMEEPLGQESLFLSALRNVLLLSLRQGKSGSEMKSVSGRRPDVSHHLAPVILGI